MELILSCIAILLSLLSFYIARNKASKRVFEEIRSMNSELQRKIDELQKLISIIQDRSTPVMPAVAQAEVSSREISMLKTEVGCIRRDLQANSQKILIHSQMLEAINEKESASAATEISSSDIFRHELDSFSKLNRSVQGSHLFDSLEKSAKIEAEQPIHRHPNEDSSSVEESSAQQLEPYEQVVQQYQDARDRSDRQALRRLQFKELNITSECEDLLLRGSSGQATKLEAVPGGGSYMVVIHEGRYWLFPTAQTLDSFSMNQPQKKIFDYERELLSKPIVKKPAEVKEESGYWVVIAQGVISIPG